VATPRKLTSPALRVALRVALVLVVGTATCLADNYDDRRLRTGAKLFRALLAADLGLQDRVTPDGHLKILVLAQDTDAAGEVTGLIAGAGGPEENRIRGLPLAIEVVSSLHDTPGRVAGVFIASRYDSDRIGEIARWGIARRTIVYSPFEGHVEKGVLAGLSVEARVRPFLNRKTMEESGIHLKPFFLQVVRMYE